MLTAPHEHKNLRLVNLRVRVVRGWQLLVAYTNEIRVLLQQYTISVIFDLSDCWEY